MIKKTSSYQSCGRDREYKMVRFKVPQYMFCCTLLYVHSSFEIILMGKKELFALLSLSCWCLVIVAWLFVVLPRGAMSLSAVCDFGIS